ncbi:MAG: FecR domain-containing protein [Planctomycetota bacterium]
MTIPNRRDTMRERMLRYLEGALSDVEVVEFNRCLREDPSLKREFAEILIQRAQLVEIGKEMKEVRRVSPKRRRSPAVWMSIAASLAIIVGSAIFVPWRARQAPERVRAVLAATVSGAAVEREGKRIPAEEGMVLLVGDAVVTTGMKDASSVKLTYPDEKTELLVDANTRFRLLDEKQGKRYRLESGKIEAIVAKQPAGRPMEIVTRHAEVEIAGTRFTLAVSPEKSRLDVAKGLVRMRSLDGGNRIDVAEGCVAEAGPGIVLAAKALSSAPAPARAQPLRVWTFKSPEASKDIPVVNGSWRWVPDGGPDGKGCMEMETVEMVLNLGLTRNRTPFMSEVEYQLVWPPNNTKSTFCLIWSWSNTESTAFLTNIWERKVMKSSSDFGKWVSVTGYITDRWVDTWMFNKRNCFDMFWTTDRSRLEFYVRGPGRVRINKITVTPIDASQLPDVSLYLNAVEKIAPEKRKGLVALPGLPSIGPSKSAAVHFYP